MGAEVSSAKAARPFPRSALNWVQFFGQRYSRGDATIVAAKAGRSAAGKETGEGVHEMGRKLKDLLHRQSYLYTLSISTPPNAGEGGERCP